jgi:hypothetical protein
MTFAVGAAHLLGVPLYAQAEGRSLALDGFRKLVLRSGHHAQARSRLRHGLVVEAVDPRLRVAECVGEAAAGGHLDGVSSPRFGQAMGFALGTFRGDVVNERATVVQRQELHAVADGQHRQIALEGSSQQGAIKGELRLRHRLEFHAFGVAGRRREIISAREQQAVDAADEAHRVALLWQIDGGGTRFHDGVGVCAVDVVVAAVLPPAPRLVEARGNPDERPHRLEYTFRSFCGRRRRTSWVGC